MQFAEQTGFSLSLASPSDVPELAALHRAAAADLTTRHGWGPWSPSSSEKGLLFSLKHSRVLAARVGSQMAGTLHLQPRKPWAIDVSCFTPVKRAIYLTHMAVAPAWQGFGLGRRLLAEAAAQAKVWPADAIRLDAFDSEAGAGAFYLKCGFSARGRAVYRSNPLLYFELLV
jgi:ribosomal protein S18 acetylase RimI-like enzyme